MEIYYGGGNTQYGPGVQIDLTEEEVDLAIMAYLVSQDVHIFGPSLITVNEEFIQQAEIYVYPSGSVVANGKKYTGRGPQDES